MVDPAVESVWFSAWLKLSFLSRPYIADREGIQKCSKGDREDTEKGIDFNEKPIANS